MAWHGMVSQERKSTSPPLPVSVKRILLTWRGNIRGRKTTSCMDRIRNKKRLLSFYLKTCTRGPLSLSLSLFCPFSPSPSLSWDVKTQTATNPDSLGGGERLRRGRSTGSRMRISTLCVLWVAMVVLAAAVLCEGQQEQGQTQGEEEEQTLHELLLLLQEEEGEQGGEEQELEAAALASLLSSALKMGRGVVSSAAGLVGKGIKAAKSLVSKAPSMETVTSGAQTAMMVGGAVKDWKAQSDQNKLAKMQMEMEREQMEGNKKMMQMQMKAMQQQPPGEEEADDDAGVVDDDADDDDVVVVTHWME